MNKIYWNFTWLVVVLCVALPFRLEAQYYYATYKNSLEPSLIAAGAATVYTGYSGGFLRYTSVIKQDKQITTLKIKVFPGNNGYYPSGAFYIYDYKTINIATLSYSATPSVADSCDAAMGVHATVQEVYPYASSQLDSSKISMLRSTADHTPLYCSGSVSVGLQMALS